MIWTALVVQWLRNHLPMQGTGVQSLVWGDSTWHATVQLSPSTTTVLSPHPLEPVLCNREALIFLKRSLIFPILFFPLLFCIEECFLISPYYSMELCSNVYIFLFLLCFSLLFFSQLFVRLPQKAILFFPWEWSWSLSPIQCSEPPSIVHQALYLSDLVT